MFFSSAGDRKAGGGNRTRMASLEGCALPVTNSIGNKDLENSKYQGMPQSMPCGHENDTDLAHLVQVWPHLPDHIKRAIKALITTVEENSDEMG